MERVSVFLSELSILYNLTEQEHGVKFDRAVAAD